jgi:hypothetical protein
METGYQNFDIYNIINLINRLIIEDGECRT